MNIRLKTITLLDNTALKTRRTNIPYQSTNYKATKYKATKYKLQTTKYKLKTLNRLVQYCTQCRHV